MSLTVPTSITGTNIASLSSMVLTSVEAQPPETNAKRCVVTALASGTAANVRMHSVSDPFDFTFWTPKSPKALPAQNPQGIRPTIPMNTYSVVGRKGLRPASDVASISSPFTFQYQVPAGAESYDSANLAAMLSAMAAVLTAKAASLYDNALTGSN